MKDAGVTDGKRSRSAANRARHTSARPASGGSLTLRDAEWIVGLIDANTPMPAWPRPKPGS